MLSTILNGSLCAGFVFVMGTTVLSFAFIAQFREPDPRGGLGILLGIEFVILCPISIAVGGLIASLARWLASEFGWGASPMFPLIGSIIGGFLLAIAATIYNNQNLGGPVIPPSAPVAPAQAAGFMVLKGHGSVDGMDLSPGGDQLASSNYKNNAVCIWKVSTGEMIRMIEPQGNHFGVNKVSWSPNGQQLAAGLTDGPVHVWETGTWNPLLTLEDHKSPVGDLKWSPNGDRLASGSLDGTATIWDIQTGRSIVTLQHSNGVRLAWSPNAKQLVTTATDGTLIVWDVQSGTPSTKLEGHSSSILSVAWSPDSSMLASALVDPAIIIWDTQTWQPVRTLLGHYSRVASVAWSPDGMRLASSSDDRTVAVWDPRTGQKLFTFEGNSYSQQSHVFWLRDGKTIISTWGYEVVIWYVGAQIHKDILT